MSSEGCLMVRVRKSITNSTGLQVGLVFQITQHSAPRGGGQRDEKLLISFINYFGSGMYRQRTNGLTGDFYVSKYTDITEKIIPFFDLYPILGVKALDFEDFKKVAKLMSNSAHLNLEGLKQIKQIQIGMNRAR